MMMTGWLDGTEAVKTEQQIAGLATEIAPSSKQGKRTRPSSSTGLGRKRNRACASLCFCHRFCCCSTGDGSREERRKKRVQKKPLADRQRCG
jgi:hypothetical protein